mmetsp:Transcript_111003/g.347331  ORF Transcript_111003/g.347331 Transcript_111003/m.347331 type:complete len:235 (+) Transcript_111003:138-842(+)
MGAGTKEACRLTGSGTKEEEPIEDGGGKAGDTIPGCCCRCGDEPDVWRREPSAGPGCGLATTGRLTCRAGGCTSGVTAGTPGHAETAWGRGASRLGGRNIGGGPSRGVRELCLSWSSWVPSLLSSTAWAGPQAALPLSSKACPPSSVAACASAGRSGSGGGGSLNQALSELAPLSATKNVEGGDSPSLVWPLRWWGLSELSCCLPWPRRQTYARTPETMANTSPAAARLVGLGN